jgi:UDP-N-acetylmuramoylalanine-D-glutamate ligase
MKQGHPVVSELEFASEKIPREVKMIAVTGTNGKSTVTSFSGQVFYLFRVPHEHAVG